MAPPSRPIEADRVPPGAGDAAGLPVAEPLPATAVHATPEHQLTHALACFQAKVSAIPAAEPAAVVEAARPAFRGGLSWSAQLREQQGRPRLQVTVMHVAGAELCSEAWADEAGDLAAMTGLMLALLLGIPVSAEARTQEPCSAVESVAGSEPPGDTAQVADATGAAEPAPVDGDSRQRTAAESDPALLPLTEEEIAHYHRRVLDLPQATRRELTTAFREHFQVPRSARSIGDRITQHQHAAFIDHFLEESQGQGLDGAQAPVEP